MLDLLQSIQNTLAADATLAGLMNTTAPNKRIFVGRVDVVKEVASSIGLPMLVIKGVSESFVTVPITSRNSRIQIDIWSQNSELETAKIYERICTLLNYQSSNINTSHIFWQRGDGFVEQFESEANLFHFLTDIVLWSH